MWIYNTAPWLVLLVAFFLLWLAAIAGHLLATFIRKKSLPKDYFHLAEYIPTTVLGLLVLLLGFTFSLTIARFEGRRQLAIDEANAISTARLRTKLLISPERVAIDDLLRQYVESRIKYYDTMEDRAKLELVSEGTARIQEQIWDHAVSATQTDRGALENGFATAMTQMFDVKNTRDIALTKNLPALMYGAILLISMAGLMTYGFLRGEHGERGHWQPGILALMIAFVFYMILDIDRPHSGRIQISQEAITALRKEWK